MVSTPTLAALEARILAHRKILAQLIAASPGEALSQLTSWMEDRAVVQDGQEDPGSLPTEGVLIELTIAEEIALILDLSRGILGRDEGGRG